MALFNNNFKFHHKNSASPSICLLVKNINHSLKNTGMNNTPGIQNILNTLNYDQDDFKYFFKIWPNINSKTVFSDNKVNKLWLPIRDMWIKTCKSECDALNYEKKVYHLLDDVKRNDVVRDNNYTVTPILADSNKFFIEDFAKLLGDFKESDEDFELFVYIFYIWLKDPSQPNNSFSYNKEKGKALSLSEIEKKLVKSIYNGITFSCIMTPVIMGDNVTTFTRLIKNTKDNINDGISVDVVMVNFCTVFVNIIKGIKNLKNKNIAHNDLHSGNIFVQRLSNNTFNTFIYDFDRSYSQAFGDNPLLNNDLCKDSCSNGQCNRYDNWLDFFKILHYIFSGTPLNFKKLLFDIITDSPNNPHFNNIIGIIEISAFFTNPVTNCCWYWKPTAAFLIFTQLLVNYDTVIERLNAYRIQALLSKFSFVSPSKKVVFRAMTIEQKKLYNQPSDFLAIPGKIENIKRKSDVLNKMPSNKLSIDLITGKYIDLSIKRPQRPSTVINTSEKFEEVIEENNKMKAMLKNHK
jgi:hypothetical protein